MINNVIKDKVKNSMVVGQKVNIVQKTKKTPGVIKKIMQSIKFYTITDLKQ